MVIDFSQKLKDIYGEPLPKEANREPTLGVVAIGALLGPEDGLTDAEKAVRYKIALMIAQATGPVTLSLDDAALVKKLIGKHPLPLVVGQAYDMLERGANG